MPEAKSNENSWELLELDYARKLKICPLPARKDLYFEAYKAVAEQRMMSMPENPEKRTAGTSKSLAELLIGLCSPNDTVLEVGCGRGYTCLELSKHVKTVVATDVSDPVLEETRQLLRDNNVNNVLVQKAAADELTDNFDYNSFNKVFTIDVYEHLHPEDGLNHLKQVYKVLKPRGAYICIVPNRLSGPHDVTRIIYPDAREAMGFHLNETTVNDLINIMKEIGFSEFYYLRPFTCKSTLLFYVRYRACYQAFFERFCPRFRKPRFFGRIYGRLVQIRLMAVKGV